MYIKIGLVMAIPAQLVEVGPRQAIRLYACKALGAAGPYARCWPVFTAILIAKKIQAWLQLFVLAPYFYHPYPDLPDYILQKHRH